MKDLIEALTILLKYGDKPYPTGCEHDVLHVYAAGPDTVADADEARLLELGFSWDDDTTSWRSTRFGSA